MNTGHIDILKYIPKSCNLDLSNTPKNNKHCSEFEKKKIKFKCIIYRYLPWYLPSQIPNLDPQDLCWQVNWICGCGSMQAFPQVYLQVTCMNLHLCPALALMMASQQLWPGLHTWKAKAKPSGHSFSVSTNKKIIGWEQIDKNGNIMCSDQLRWALCSRTSHCLLTSPTVELIHPPLFSTHTFTKCNDAPSKFSLEGVEHLLVQHWAIPAPNDHVFTSSCWILVGNLSWSMSKSCTPISSRDPTWYPPCEWQLNN